MDWSDLPRSFDLPELAGLASQTPLADRYGRVAAAIGTLIRVRGLNAALGELCALTRLGSDDWIEAEVVGFSDDGLLLTPLSDLRGLTPHFAAVALNRSLDLEVGPALCGRILDGFGQPLDGRPLPIGLARRPVAAPPPHPLQRSAISTPLQTGVRAIDGLLSCGVGQRLGIFAPAGCGKSTLLGMIARNAAANVNVIALIGERGREVREFIDDCLGTEGLRRSVVVVATSDRPALERMKAAQVATAIAEYFRDQGQSVLLLVDSVTRYARALREIGLAAGEPPTRRAFPPSVFSALPQLFERAGQGERGAITGFYTVLEETDGGDDPIGEEVRSLLDGHLVLSRQLASQGHYPAIDVLASVSRVMNRVSGIAHQHAALRARALAARYRELELLIRVGEFRAGQDAESDAAVAAHPRLNAFLRQGTAESADLSTTLQTLEEIVR